MIVVLSDEQLERIENAFESACDVLVKCEDVDPLLFEEMADALGVVKAARALLAA